MAGLTSVDFSNVPVTLEQWRTTLNSVLQAPKSITTPLNVAAVAKEGAIVLSWAAVKGANGYEVRISPSGSFLDTLIVSLPNAGNTTYTDAGLGGTPTKRFYEVVAFTGSIVAPDAVKSKPSVTVSATSLPFPATPTTVLAQSNASITSATTSSVTSTALGLSATLNVVQNPTGFTPTVLVLVNGTVNLLDGVITAAGMAFTLLRDGSGLFSSVTNYAGVAAGVTFTVPVTMSFIDTPGVGSHTYSLNWNVGDSRNTAQILTAPVFISVIQFI